MGALADRLIPDWKTIATKAWSVRLSLLAAVLSAMEVGLPFFTSFMPEHVMAVLAALVALGAAVARMVAQPAMREDDEAARLLAEQEAIAKAVAAGIAAALATLPHKAQLVETP